MVEKGKPDPLVDGVHKSMAAVSFFTHMGWILAILLRLGVGLKDMTDYMAWTSELLKERKKV